MTLQAPKHITRATPRDVFTGAPIEAGTIHHPVDLSDGDKVMAPRYLEREGERVRPAPAILHRHEMDGEAGLAYSLFFGQYLAAALDEVKADWRREGAREAHEWWTSAYGVKMVHTRMRDLYSETDAATIVEAVLSVCRDHEDPGAVADRMGRAYDWLGRKANLCMKLAHMSAANYAIWRAKCQAKKVLV